MSLQIWASNAHNFFVITLGRLSSLDVLRIVVFCFSEMPSWKCKQANRRRLKMERRAASARAQLRIARHYASMFITLIDYFLSFLRPLEVRALMCLSRESSSRHWDNLLNQYMRFYYHQECNRLFGPEWIRSWLVPVRTKLATVLNRVCICGAVTDQFDFVGKQRLCIECAREAGYNNTCSLTTPLFYDEDVFATVNMWTQDPVALLETIPTGKRVEVDGSIVTDYDSIVIENAIWISGVSAKKSQLRMGCYALVIRASVYVTDLCMSSGHDQGWQPTRREAHPAVQVLPLHDFTTVRISDCLISNRAGSGILVHGGHVLLLKNHFRRCAYSAITCNGGTVEAVHNRFRRLSSWCFQENQRSADVMDTIAKFRANNEIRSRAPHFYFRKSFRKSLSK